MVETNNEKKDNTAAGSTPGEYDDTVMLRLPSAFIMLTADQENNGRTYEGTVGFKYGSGKQDWLRLSYTEAKKFIDFCQENKQFFNKQLQNERKKMGVSDL